MKHWNLKPDKPFEITVKEGEVLGAMSSFSYLGTKWAGANTDLLYGILRDEWGFDGFVSSDAVLDLWRRLMRLFRVMT